MVSQSSGLQLEDEWNKTPQWLCPRYPVEKKSLACVPPSSCSCRMCSLFRPWLSHSSKQPALFSFPVTQLLSLFLSRVCFRYHTVSQPLSLSLSLCRSLSLSLSLSHSPSPPHWQGGKGGSSEAARKNRLPPPSPRPASRRVLSVSVRERDPDTDQRAAAFPQPGRTRGERRREEWRREGGGWRQREQSIPPTGCTRSYRLVHTVSSNQHSTNLSDFIPKPVKLNKLLSRYNFLKTLLAY